MRIIHSDECFKILMANLYRMNIKRHSTFMELVKDTVGYAIDDNVIILRNIGNGLEITYMEAKGKAKVRLLDKARSFNKPLLYTGVTNCIPNNSIEIADGVYQVQ